MHRTGHWIGLDVHDAGEYREGDGARSTSKARVPGACSHPGMTLTVEPGSTCAPPEDVPEQYWNIGMRIEDDALVTDIGCEMITLAAPEAADEIEALMRDSNAN